METPGQIKSQIDQAEKAIETVTGSARTFSVRRTDGEAVDGAAP